MSDVDVNWRDRRRELEFRGYGSRNEQIVNERCQYMLDLRAKWDREDKEKKNG